MNQVKQFFHHFMLPRETNNFKAKALHLDLLTLYLVVMLLVTVGMKRISTNPGSVLGFAVDINQTKLLELTNEERAKNGLPPLRMNEKLSQAANSKAQDMFSKGYWAHFAPDGSTTPWQFITGAGYSYRVAGENLAKNFPFSDSVVEAWMNSPSHRANMLRADYQDVGFAIVNGNLAGEDTTLVVEMFGTPLNGADNVASAPVQQPPQQAQAPAAAADQKTLVANLKPTAAVTSIPGIAGVANLTPQQAQAVSLNTNVPKINLFPIVYNLGTVFLLFLATALIFDFYFAKKLNVARISGRNLAHAMFVVFVFIGLMVISKGGIIQ
jgi:hypothetical protein